MNQTFTRFKKVRGSHQEPISPGSTNQQFTRGIVVQKNVHIKIPNGKINEN
jgi:hypothetical protein